jgi:hypothetical protein
MFVRLDNSRRAKQRAIGPHYILCRVPVIVLNFQSQV